MDFASLPYHQELKDHEAELCDKNHATSQGEHFIFKGLPDYLLFQQGEFDTMSYVKHLATLSVQSTFAEFQRSKSAFGEGLYSSTSYCNDMLRSLHWGLNENGGGHKRPVTHSAFTRYVKLMLLEKAHSEEGFDFLKFFMAQNPSWHFQRSEHDPRRGRREIDFFLSVSFSAFFPPLRLS